MKVRDSASWGAGVGLPDGRARGADAGVLMIQSFVLVHQLLNFAAWVAAGADEFLPGRFQVFLIHLQCGFCELKVFVEHWLMAFVSLGQKLLQPGNLFLLRLHLVLKDFHPRQDRAGRGRNGRRMLSRVVQGRGEGQIHLMISQAQGILRELLFFRGRSQGGQPPRGNQGLFVHQGGCRCRLGLGRRGLGQRVDPVSGQDRGHQRQQRNQHAAGKKSPAKSLHRHLASGL